MAKYDDKDWLSDLDPADPPGTEEIALGDNLLRAIQRALKNAFPNTTDGDQYTGTLSQLNSISAGSAFPRDCVIAWAGDQDVLPDGPEGWTICDGRARKDGLGGNAPDLRSRFIGGAQVNTASNPLVPYVGFRGGSTEVDIRKADGTLIKFTTDGHVLNADEIGAHSHAMFTTEKTDGDAALGSQDLVAFHGYDNSSDLAYKMQPSALGSSTIGRTGSAGTGGNNAHTHTFSIDGSATYTGANIPPYESMLFIIKD